MASQHQLAKNEFVKVWVTRLPSLSHLPLSMWRHRVPCLPPKNASAQWGGPGSRWLTIIVRQISYIQYLLACQKSQRSTPYNIVKSVLAWSRVFRRRHLGRRVTAVTCLRWPTVCPSVRLSVCLSVRLSHLFDYVSIIVSSLNFSEVINKDQGKVDAKGQGQRSKVKVTEVTTQPNRFRTANPVWIHIWWWNDAYSLMTLRRGALLFFKDIRQISRSHGSKKRQILPR